MEHFLQGCSENLVLGGEVLLAGPFFNSGEAGDSLLVYDAALRDFSNERSEINHHVSDIQSQKAVSIRKGFD